MTTAVQVLNRRPDVLTKLFVSPHAGQLRPMHSIVRVYDALVLMSNQMGMAEIDFSRIEAMLNLSPRALRRVLARLIGFRLIIVTEKRRTDSGGRGDVLTFRVIVRHIYRLFKRAGNALYKRGLRIWKKFSTGKAAPPLPLNPENSNLKPLKTPQPRSRLTPGRVVSVVRGELEANESLTPRQRQLITSALGRMLFKLDYFAHVEQSARVLPALLAAARHRTPLGDLSPEDTDRAIFAKGMALFVATIANACGELQEKHIRSCSCPQAAGISKRRRMHR